MKEYTIVSGAFNGKFDEELFCSRVTQLIAEGWEPLGGISTAVEPHEHGDSGAHWATQALVRTVRKRRTRTQ